MGIVKFDVGIPSTNINDDDGIIFSINLEEGESV